MKQALVFGTALALMLALQVYASLRQMRLIQTEYRAVKDRNHVVSVGKSSRFGMNRTALLAFDAKGFLQEAYILKGVTVFAKFKRIKGHDGEHYSKLKEHYSKNKRMACVVQAVRYMEEQYGR